jgi:hypothetical protein
MKNLSLPALLVSAILIFGVQSCKKNKDDSPQPLAYAYEGQISVEYTKGFPEFSITIPMDVTINKDRTVEFGNGGSEDFDKEDILYEGTKPVTKIHMTGTVTFQSAKGEYKEINGTEYLWVWVNSSIVGQMTVWGWDKDLGWMQVIDTPFNYEDLYSDGQMQFKITEAELGGASIKKTLPDLQGTFTYGYFLTLTLNPWGTKVYE